MPRRKKKHFTDHQRVMKDVLALLCRVLRKARPDTARRWFAAVSVGVLATTKLLARLQTRGTLVLTMDPEGIDILEELSEELAEEYFELVAAEVRYTDAYRPRLGPSRFVRSERTLIFRWAQPLAAGTPIPAELDDMPLLASISEKVISGMLDVFARAVRSSNEERVNGKIASFIAFTAAVKVIMAFWDDAPLASAIDTLADLVSERRYHQLRPLLREPDGSADASLGGPRMEAAQTPSVADSAPLDEAPTTSSHAN